jgi:hypothetical protein
VADFRAQCADHERIDRFGIAQLRGGWLSGDKFVAFILPLTERSECVPSSDLL